MGRWGEGQGPFSGPGQRWRGPWHSACACARWRPSPSSPSPPPRTHPHGPYPPANFCRKPGARGARSHSTTAPPTTLPRWLAPGGRPPSRARPRAGRPAAPPTAGTWPRWGLGRPARSRSSLACPRGRLAAVLCWGRPPERRRGGRAAPPPCARCCGAPYPRSSPRPPPRPSRTDRSHRVAPAGR